MCIWPGWAATPTPATLGCLDSETYGHQDIVMRGDQRAQVPSSSVGTHREIASSLLRGNANLPAAVKPPRFVSALGVTVPCCALTYMGQRMGDGKTPPPPGWGPREALLDHKECTLKADSGP